MKSKFCTKCGHEIEDKGAIFCTNCGQKLNLKNNIQEKHKTSGKKSLFKGFLVGIGSIFIVAILLFVFVLNSEKDITDELLNDNTELNKDIKNTETTKNKSLQGLYLIETTFTEVIKSNETQKNYSGKTRQNLLSIKKSDLEDKDYIIYLKSLNGFSIPVQAKSNNKNYSGEFISEKYEVYFNSKLTPEEKTIMTGEYMVKDYYGKTEFSAKLKVYPLEKITLDKLVGVYDINIQGFNVVEEESNNEIINLMGKKTQEYKENKITAEIINTTNGKDGIIKFYTDSKSKSSLYNFSFGKGSLTAILEESNNDLFTNEKVEFYSYCSGQRVLLLGNLFLKFSDKETMRIFFKGTKK